MELTINTTAGEKTSTITAYVNGNMPFGQTMYRATGTCTQPENLVAAFWDAVDDVLSEHGLGPDDFLRVIRATSGDLTIGEL